MEFSRQEQWSGLPFSSPGVLPDTGIEPRSPALAGSFLTTEPPGKPSVFTVEFLTKHKSDQVTPYLKLVSGFPLPLK